MGDAFEDLPADEDAEDDGGEEDGVGGEGAGVDDAEVGGEGDFEEVDEDLRESFLTQKNKINEMFNRFNRYN